MGKNDLLLAGAALAAGYIVMNPGVLAKAALQPSIDQTIKNLQNDAQLAVAGVQQAVNYGAYVATHDLPGYNPISGVGLFNNGVYVGGYDPTLYGIYQATGY